MSLSDHKEELAQAQMLMSQGRFMQAEEIIEQLVQDSPCAQLFYHLGVAKARAGKQHRAINDFNQAIALDPKLSEGYNGLALALYELGELNAANDICHNAFAQTKPCVKIYSTWAKILRTRSQLKQAKELLASAIEEYPNDASLWCNLAAVVAEMNDKPAAIDCYRQALAINPALIDLHERIADHSKYDSIDNPHITEMIQALEYSKSPSVASGVCFGLAKAYEQLKDYKKSAHFYRQANSYLQKLKPYNHEHTKNQFKVIKSTFTKEYISKISTAENTDSTPIFILGMPRSGTSLVEQILASHSDVYGAGELNYIKSLIVRSGDYGPEDFAAAVQSLNVKSSKNISKNYVRLLREFDGGVRFITDKMPHNFRFIGLICCLFPGAKIVHCQRNRPDVVLSNFKAHFVANLRYSTSLDAINKFYDLYEDLMAFWNQSFPDRIYTFRYEALINDQEQKTRELLSYCGLNWQESCLNYHNTKRTVATASAGQVKQPLYKTAVAYWQNYHEYLPELSET